jgi:hypothetical protein
MTRQSGAEVIEFTAEAQIELLLAMVPIGEANALPVDQPTRNAKPGTSFSALVAAANEVRKNRRLERMNGDGYSIMERLEHLKGKGLVQSRPGVTMSLYYR